MTTTTSAPLTAAWRWSVTPEMLKPGHGRRATMLRVEIFHDNTKPEIFPRPVVIIFAARLSLRLAIRWRLHGQESTLFAIAEVVTRRIFDAS